MMRSVLKSGRRCAVKVLLVDLKWNAKQNLHSVSVTWRGQYLCRSICNSRTRFGHLLKSQGSCFGFSLVLHHLRLSLRCRDIVLSSLGPCCWYASAFNGSSSVQLIHVSLIFHGRFGRSCFAPQHFCMCVVSFYILWSKLADWFIVMMEVSGCVSFAFASHHSYSSFKTRKQYYIYVGVVHVWFMRRQSRHGAIAPVCLATFQLKPMSCLSYVLLHSAVFDISVYYYDTSRISFLLLNSFATVWCVKAIFLTDRFSI